MITLRAEAATPGLAAAVAAVTGGALPGVRRIARGPLGACAWMSPDEWLLILPPERVEGAQAALAAGLAGQHHLAVDVSDARAVFRIEGAKAAEVLMKLTPADLGALAADEVRRTRLAQVACAFWAEEGGYTLVAFRSVAGYVRGLLDHSARGGAELF
jgi:sarcosine oxidase subunit gamma